MYLLHANSLHMAELGWQLVHIWAFGLELLQDKRQEGHFAAALDTSRLVHGFKAEPCTHCTCMMHGGRAEMCLMLG